jgi:hypothetical protein
MQGVPIKENKMNPIRGRAASQTCYGIPNLTKPHMNKISIPVESDSDIDIDHTMPNIRNVSVSGIYLTYTSDFTGNISEWDDNLGIDTTVRGRFRGTYVATADKFVSVSVLWNSDTEDWTIRVAFASDSFSINSSDRDLLEEAMSMILEWHQNHMTA